MLYEFSRLTKSDKVPAGSDWIHEIKYDGYRMMLIREQDRVRVQIFSSMPPGASLLTVCLFSP
jgi:ATP-dependent DNA ligase